MHKEVLIIAVSAVAVVTAVLTISRRNPIYGTFFLITHLLSVSALLAMLGAFFIGAIHVLVYTGAIMVLFLFVVMLLNLKEDELGAEFGAFRKIVFILPAIVILFVFISAAGVRPADLPYTPSLAGVSFEGTSRVLFGKYFMAFEIVSALIILAVIGSVLIAKKKL